jgi:hypothetical protein
MSSITPQNITAPNKHQSQQHRILGLADLYQRVDDMTRGMHASNFYHRRVFTKTPIIDSIIFILHNNNNSNVNNADSTLHDLWGTITISSHYPRAKLGQEILPLAELYLHVFSEINNAMFVIQFQRAHVALFGDRGREAESVFVQYWYFYIGGEYTIHIISCTRVAGSRMRQIINQGPQQYHDDTNNGQEHTMQ